MRTTPEGTTATTTTQKHTSEFGEDKQKDKDKKTTIDSSQLRQIMYYTRRKLRC